MDKKAVSGNRPLGGDYVIVDKQGVTSKQGVLFIEARIRSDVVSDPKLEIGFSKARNAISLLLLGAM